MTLAATCPSEGDTLGLLMTTADQPPDEARALARLASDELRRVTGDIGRIHLAISGRVFGLVGPMGKPTQIVHDTITSAVYGGVGAAMSVAGEVADQALKRRQVADPHVVSASPKGSKVIGVLNGFIGDQLECEGSALAQSMSVRVDGRAIPLTTEALRTAFPTATGRLVVFLHGLTFTELSWDANAGLESYGAQLAHDLDVTPVYVRYNTGRHISSNGRSLDQLLASLVSEWPVGVTEIALVGHSMGGLVARSSTYHGAQRDAEWVKLVRHVVGLSAPHMGAPLEQAVHYASAALNLVPETRPFASFLRRRSDGIRDLRQGSLVDEDWQGRDPDALRAEAI